MPVVVITGARQTGKTTLVQQSKCSKNRKYFSFDQLDVLEQAKRNPTSLLKDLPVTIDEVQRAPEFLLAVKQHIDQSRSMGSIILTGSANFELINSTNESLAGRCVYLNIPPFCYSEWKQQKTALELINSFFEKNIIEAYVKNKVSWPECLFTGGYPSSLEYSSSEGRKFWFSGYLQTYLERDLRMISQIVNLVDFQRVMRLSAFRVGKLLNQSEVARDAAITQPTCHRYLNLLEAGYQITRLNNFCLNSSKSIIKSKKLLWTDSGLAAFLAGLEDESTLFSRPDFGFWLEQTLFQTFQSWKATALDHQIFYWRGNRQEEVDFVLVKNNKAVPIEIKAHTQVFSDDLKSIKAFQKSFEGKYHEIKGIIFYGGNEMRYLDHEIYAIPIRALLS